MKRIILTLFTLAITFTSASGWGREGHEIIAKIADNNLRPSVRKKIESYLGQSIVYYAKWMDDYRHTPEYGFTTRWHAVHVNKDLKYTPHPLPEGDAVYGLTYATDTLKNYRNLQDSTVSVNIKYILHIVGDMHCPGHIKYQGIQQEYNVHFGGPISYIQPDIDTRMHFVWDKYAIQSCRIWSVSEYAEELDRKSRREIKAMIDGDYVDWVQDNAARCLIQFELSHPGDTLQEDFVNAAMPFIETQMLYAGYRLAHVLNRIFK